MRILWTRWVELLRALFGFLVYRNIIFWSEARMLGIPLRYYSFHAGNEGCLLRPIHGPWCVSYAYLYGYISFFVLFFSFFFYFSFNNKRNMMKIHGIGYLYIDVCKHVTSFFFSSLAFAATVCARVWGWQLFILFGHLMIAFGRNGSRKIHFWCI